MSEPNVVTVHVRYRLIFRHLRRYLLGVVCLSFVFGVAGGVAAHLTHSNRVAPAGHASVASSLLILLGPLLTISYIFWVAQRIGYYARPGEIGTVGVVGRLTPLRQPAVRFHRFTMTNRRWLRFLGMGSLVSVPVVVGIARLAMQAVEPPDHHAVTQPELDVAQESLVFGSRLPGVERAEIVIHIHLGDAPAPPFRLRETIGFLALDPKALA